LGDYVGQHGGKAANTTGQSAVAAALKTWQASGSGDTSGLMAFGAQAGWVSVTPKTHVTYAGENIDQVAQQDLQLTGGARITAAAGQGVHLFGRGEGVSAIAGDGPMLLQAQQDTLSATAQKAVHITSIGDEVVIAGKTIRLVAEDGSYVKIGGGVQVGSDGAFVAHTGGHDFLGPNTDHVAPPAFSSNGADQRFRLRYPGTDSAEMPHPVPNRPYEITLHDGRVIKGISDGQGLTDLTSSDAMHIAHIKVFDAQG
ncbi:DUF2345 domain-containing protein, partial [Trinickia caryophylli]